MDRDFGTSVAIGGSIIAVGSAHLSSNPQYAPGTVYLFHRGTKKLVRKVGRKRSWEKALLIIGGSAGAGAAVGALTGGKKGAAIGAGAGGVGGLIYDLATRKD